MTIEPMSATQDNIQPDGSLLLPVDREHTGIRLAGCTSMIATGILVFAVSSLLFNLTPIFAIIIAMVVAIFSTTMLERNLKGNWLSGRELIANEQQIALRKSGDIERAIDPNQPVNTLSWHFVVERSRRVRKGWHVVGFSLEQDNEYIPVYTLASPEDFEAINSLYAFTKLQRPKPTDKEAKTSLRQAGEQRRLLEAEQDRGYNGAELTVEEFKTYLTYLQTQHPTWMAS